jgi:hypothetical protein
MIKNSPITGTTVIVCLLDSLKVRAYHVRSDWLFLYPQLIDRRLEKATTRRLTDRELIIFADNVTHMKSICENIESIMKIPNGHQPV